MARAATGGPWRRRRATISGHGRARGRADRPAVDALRPHGVSV